MPEQSVFAAELSWADYDARVRGGDTPILLPIGSMEQHGHHMPMNVDVLLPVEFARRVASRIGALVAPPFTYGYKSHQKSGGGNHLPGTTSLDGATLVAALRDVLKEFARHGVRRICLFNGHFENSWFIIEGIDLALRELKWSGIDDMKVVVLSYWDFVDKDTINRLYPKGFPGWEIEHGGVLETSLMLALYPEQVRLERAIDHAPASFPPYDVYPPKPEWTPASGTLSSPKEASAEKGEILLQVCADGIVKALETEFPR
ncbi:creatinine amidohydrolase [Pseudaminobacter salicylatoxidans]|uniref:Creatinine amidohydrolase n=1 Tax=Pseudaminobacter salicylatoxidans TaxID=93369 RepID=A0A316CAR5_PSESE|nr:creatininase [Pseudaminobacter salicylatoxidans]PWJ86273.1 creatinine amidohydrolase [Pseudaminobacter salicylatoxidans]